MSLPLDVSGINRNVYIDLGVRVGGVERLTVPFEVGPANLLKNCVLRPGAENVGEGLIQRTEAGLKDCVIARPNGLADHATGDVVKVQECLGVRLVYGVHGDLTTVFDRTSYGPHEQVELLLVQSPIRSNT